MAGCLQQSQAGSVNCLMMNWKNGATLCCFCVHPRIAVLFGAHREFDSTDISKIPEHPRIKYRKFILKLIQVTVYYAAKPVVHSP